MGFVLNRKEYRETDGLVSIYCDDSKLRQFLYKGVFKPKAKRLSVSLPFQLLEITYQDKEGLLIPRDIVTKKTYSSILDYPKTLILAQSINSLFYSFNHHLSFQLYQWSLESLAETENDRLVFCLVLSQALRIMGLQPYVDGDVNTGQTSINHFDIEKGGFVYTTTKSPFNVNQLRMLRQIFKAKPENYSIIMGDSIDFKVLSTIVEYFEYHTSFTVKGFRLYQSIQ